MMEPAPGHPRRFPLTPWYWVVAAVVLRSLAALLIKGAAVVGDTTTSSLMSPFYLAALGCFFLQAISWTMALRKIPLTLAYPFMSAVLALNLAGAHWIFSETVTAGHVAGISLAGLGIVVLTRGESGL